MSETRSCEHCGAALAADARFCEACGRAVSAPSAPTTPAVAAPSSAAPRTNKPVWLIVGCLGAVMVFACVVAIAVGGYFYIQPTTQIRATPTMLAIFIPSTPTRAPNTVVPPTVPVPAMTPTTTPLPTLTSSSTPTPKCPPTPTLPAGVLFSDDFASRQVTECNGWSFPTSENVDYTWAANKFTISVKKNQWVGLDSPDGEFDNFGAETQAQPVGNNYAAYGLAFRQSGQGDVSSYYFFVIDTDGEYRVSKRVDGNWVSPSPGWIASPAIKPGAASNAIGVIAQGGTISLYINRVLIRTLTDSAPLSKGYVGVGVGTGNNEAPVTFSRLTILTPDQAKAAWSSASAPVVTPVISSLSQP